MADSKRENQMAETIPKDTQTPDLLGKNPTTDLNMLRKLNKIKTSN